MSLLSFEKGGIYSELRTDKLFIFLFYIVRQLFFFFFFYFFFFFFFFEIPEKGGGREEQSFLFLFIFFFLGKDNRWETVRSRGFRHQGCGWVGDIQKCT